MSDSADAAKIREQLDQSWQQLWKADDALQTANLMFMIQDLERRLAPIDPTRYKRPRRGVE